MVGNVKIYICRRGMESWKGALIIAAPSKEEAVKRYREREDGDEPYIVVEVVPTPTNTEIIYEDDFR